MAQFLIGLGNKCIDAQGASSQNGTPIILWEQNGGTNQMWTLSSDGYIESAINPYKCLDVEGANPNNGTRIILWEKNGGNNQKWNLTPDGCLTSAMDSNKCIDVRGAVNQNGTPLILWEKNGGSNQKWKFVDSVKPKPLTQCSPILQDIENLKLGITALQKDLQAASPSEKSEIIFEIRELQREIKDKNKEFETCVIQNGGSLPPKSPAPVKIIPTIPKPFGGNSAYVNRRPDKDSNTCGQAAIATMLGYLGKDPFKLPRNASGRWNDGEIIDAISNDGYGPNVLFGAFGTSSGKIKDALNHYGIYTEDWNGGFMRTDKNTVKDKLIYWISRGLAVPVMVGSNGLFDGTHNWIQDNIGYTQYHWPIVYKIENNNVYLSAPSRVISMDQFMEIWSCQPLPYSYGYNAIFCFPWM